MSWICLGESQKSHLPPVCSHKMAMNLSKDPKIALWTITGLEKPVFKGWTTLYSKNFIKKYFLQEKPCQDFYCYCHEQYDMSFDDVNVHICPHFLLNRFFNLSFLPLALIFYLSFYQQLIFFFVQFIQGSIWLFLFFYFPFLLQVYLLWLILICIEDWIWQEVGNQVGMFRIDVVFRKYRKVWNQF